MSQPAFVITRPHATSGLGCNLLSMVGALYLCERTKRNLIVDWTNMSELKDKTANYFLAFFEPIRKWRDVDVLYVNDPEVPCAAYELENSLQPGKAQFPALLEDHTDRRNVFLHAFHYALLELSGLSPAEMFRYTREFYAALTPRPHLREQLSALQPRFEKGAVIGLNVRTGNGQFSPGGPYANRVDTSVFGRDDFLDRIRHACDDCAARFPDELRHDRQIFVVTDSDPMQAALLKLPNAFAVRSRFPPTGAGHQFAGFEGVDGYSDVDSVNETIVDMFLLAQCHGLACNYTEYNRYAQYMSMFFCGNVHNIEHYFESAAWRLARAAKRLASPAKR
jgi:hypothetical protein